MRKLISSTLNDPKHSNLTLSIILCICLFATYFALVPGIVKRYETELAKERLKLNEVVLRIELHQQELDKATKELARIHDLGRDNNRLIQEIHDKIVK